MVERSKVEVKTADLCLRCKRRTKRFGLSGATGWLLSIGGCKCEETEPDSAQADGNDRKGGHVSATGIVSVTTDSGNAANQSDPLESSNADIPDCIDDRFDVIEVLGTGGMGTVYKVRDREVGSVFALKLLHQNLQSDPHVLKRFEQEAKAAERLDHPNLVPTYAHGITGSGEPYLLIEYIQGETLAQILEREGALDEDRAIALFEQICSALSYAHKNQIVHRDIKPANLIISKSLSGEETVRIVDFGIAKTLTEVDRSTRNLTQTGEVFGSPHYMSPEQCLGLMLDEKSDIYSLGCVIFEAMSGKPPFAGSNPIQLVVKHINDKPKPYLPRFSSTRKQQGLQSIAFKCLEKEADDRFQDVGEIEHALNRLKTGKTVNFNHNSKFKTSIFQKQLHITAFVIPLSLIAIYAVVYAMSSVEPSYRDQSNDSPILDFVFFMLVSGTPPCVAMLVFAIYARSCLRVARDRLATKRHWWTTFSLLLSAGMCFGTIPTFYYWGYSAFWSKHAYIWSPFSNIDLFVFPGFLISFLCAIGVIVSTIAFLVDRGPKKIELNKMIVHSGKPMLIGLSAAILLGGCFFSDIVKQLSDVYTAMPVSLCSNMRTKVVYFARQISPTERMLWHSAVVSEEIRNYEQAVIDCTDLMRLQNDKHSYSYLNALAFRARMHTLSLQWDKAIKDWTDLTKLQPEENYNYRMLANCYFSQGKYELAMECYDESLKLRIADSQTYYKKANMQIVLRDYEGALRTLEQRSKLSDGLRPNVYLTRGYIRSLQGLDADASTEYQLAINSMKKDSTCWDEIARATAYLQIGNESGALECLNKAKRLGFTAHRFFTDETSQPDELRKKLMRFVLQRKVFPADQLGRTSSL